MGVCISQISMLFRQVLDFFPLIPFHNSKREKQLFNQEKHWVPQRWSWFHHTYTVSPSFSKILQKLQDGCYYDDKDTEISDLPASLSFLTFNVFSVGIQLYEHRILLIHRL